MFSGTLYGDEKFPFEKEIRKVDQDAFHNTIDLEGIISSSVCNKVWKICIHNICICIN